MLVNSAAGLSEVMSILGCEYTMNYCGGLISDVIGTREFQCKFRVLQGEESEL